MRRKGSLLPIKDGYGSLMLNLGIEHGSLMLSHHRLLDGAAIDCGRQCVSTV